MTEQELQRWRQEFISRITAARQAKGWTQAQLAEALGTQRSNISLLESGDHNPSLDYLLKTAAALGLELDLKTVEKPIAAPDGVYELRLYDDTLMAFVFNKNEIGELSTKILFVDKSAKHQLPLDMELTEDSLLDWLSHRVIPKNRTFVEKILAAFALT
ncbi:MAG: helix-turn-helix domain-containing protein [Acidobacteriota bacterium]|nr:helix-turn-helix domain-containing protein [Acidobacteriota bacterium]